MLAQGQKFWGVSMLAGRGPVGWEGSALSSGKLLEVVRRGLWLSHKFVHATQMSRALFCAGRIPDAGWGFTVPFLTPLTPHFPAKAPWGWVRWGENGILGISLVVQWLGLCTSTAEGMHLIPSWGTKILQALRHSKKKNNYYHLKEEDAWRQ